MMCGRTGLSLNKETLRCACSYKPKSDEIYEKPDWVEEHNDGKTYTPSYNIAPTDVTPVLISASGYTDDTKRLLKPMMWGIVPPWHTTDDPETWNNDFDPETGWKGIKLLHLAGVYSVWKNKETILYCYSVITMDSNSTLDWLHHRMPAILDSEEQIEAWLDVKNVNVDMALSYLRPVKALSWHPVSTVVNNSRKKTHDCNRRVSIEQKSKSSQKTLTTWFTHGTKRKATEDVNKNEKKSKPQME